MSYRSEAYGYRPDSGGAPDNWAYEYPKTNRPPHPAPAHPQQRPQAPVQAQQHRPEQNRQKQPQRRRKMTDYMLVHGGRQVRLGPVAFWVVVGTLVIMAGWSVLTGTYFAFHDDVLKRLISRQAEMQFAYEDRIAELRAQVDRITSRQLLDQEQFEQKLDQMARRQSTLEQRAATLNSLPDMTPTSSIPRRGNEPVRPGSRKPSPLNDSNAPSDKESRAFPALNIRSAAKTRGGVEGALARLEDSLDRVESRQTNALSSLEETIESRARRMRGVLADLGINPGKAPNLPPPAATGGPFVPANAFNANTFERQIYRINLSRNHADRLSKTLASLPIRKPVDGEIDASSGFGMRVDPFIRAPAMHTGLDMRGDTGDPVRVTANGTVSSAGPNGGYGKMIEVDHGNGLSTRYAHLSAIDVKVGQTVKIGQIIGRLGSTGRSTGPHLHYETRVDGDPVDPQKYLRAGLKLGGN